MINDVLIFRTDQIGDLLATFPAIITIKNNMDNCKISLVASEKNYNYAKSFDVFEEVYLFPKEGSLLKKIGFIYKLSKKKFKYIFVLDGKDRSIISSIFVKSKLKIATLSIKKK